MGSLSKGYSASRALAIMFGLLGVETTDLCEKTGAQVSTVATPRIGIRATLCGRPATFSFDASKEVYRINMISSCLGYLKLFMDLKLPELSR